MEERQWPSSDSQRPPDGNFRGQRGNFLNDLVNDGVLTQEQADKISELLFTPARNNQNVDNQV